jgi:thiol-disulfide isomerase/thioredoxin
MKALITLALAMLWLSAYAQDFDTPLKIGEPFPPEFKLNYRGQPTPLSAWKGKNIILDFFNSNCPVCFQTMPKIDSLQRKFKGKVDFIMVGKEDGRIQKIYERFEKRLNLQMDKTFDSSLGAKLLLPFNPIYVWIDRNNIVRAISSGHKLNSDTIDLFIKGGAPTKESFIEKPQFNALDWPQDLPGNDTNAFFIRSALTIGDSTSGNYPPTLSFSEKGPFFLAVNLSLRPLYQLAILKSTALDPGDALYGKVWPKLYIQRNSTQKPLPFTGATGVYSFSFHTNQSNQDTAVLRKTMVKALENYFNYTAEIQYLEMPYYSLQRVKGARYNLRSRGGPTVSHCDASRIELINASLDQMLERVKYYSRDPQPFINDTAIDYPVDLSFEAPLINLKLVNESLQKKGLVISESKKMMAVIVLKPKQEISVKDLSVQ